MARPSIYPVIHHQHYQKTLDQAKVAHDCGADGVFLISHEGKEAEILALSQGVKENLPDLRVGVNLLSVKPEEVATVVKGLNLKLDMLWFDNAGISSTLVSGSSERLRGSFPHKVKLFAGVAFKYQDPEPDPAKAAWLALMGGFIPTTSGEGNGKAISLEKARAMSTVAEGKLAVASGMTPENIVDYRGLFGSILVSTGICNKDETINPARLKALIANAA